MKADEAETFEGLGLDILGSSRDIPLVPQAAINRPTINVA
jgi:hypothetical protein